jgi:cell division septation protein DedD
MSDKNRNDDMNEHDYDFGDDADVVLPDDPNFDAWIAQAAPSLNVPSAAPRLEMWDAIQAAQKTAAAANAGAIAGVTPLRRSRFLLPMAIAAALLVGVAIDRFSLRSPVDNGGQARIAQRPTPSPESPSSQTPLVAVPEHRAPSPERRVSAREPNAPTSTSRLYRLAAVQTLTQAEALLTAYRTSGVAERDPAAAKQLGQWGREVLSSTRLLLDSPAGDDATLRPLLNDLELVLVQIIRLSGAPLDENDRALIDDAMRVHNLLPRIRTAVPAGVAGAASDE